MVLARRSYANAKGLPIMGRFVSFAVVGVDTKVMGEFLFIFTWAIRLTACLFTGIGPAVAIHAAIAKAGLRSVDDVDLFELNEAFASQATYCATKLGLDAEKVNVNGGAIALGHPLGATCARCVATLLHEMKRRSAKNGVVSMCIGSGMGAAGVFELEA